MRIVYTIGAYGTSRTAFFDALARAHVDAFVDIRRRRAVRGTPYTFANARRLTHELGLRGIRYLHVLELAPDAALLTLQHAADAAAKVRYAQRTALDPQYVERYVPQILDRYDFAPLVRQLDGCSAPVLFCIERTPVACHRSLVAPRLAAALGAGGIEHLLPDPAAATSFAKRA